MDDYLRLLTDVGKGACGCYSSHLETTYNDLIGSAKDILVLALARVIPASFDWCTSDESSREMAEAIVKMMHTPGDGPDEEYSRGFATRLARNLLTKRSQQVAEQSQQGPHSLRSPIINTPSYRPASVLVGHENVIRKLLAQGYSYPRIAERYRVRVGAVQQYARKH